MWNNQIVHKGVIYEFGSDGSGRELHLQRTSKGYNRYRNNNKKIIIPDEVKRKAINLFKKDIKFEDVL